MARSALSRSVKLHHSRSGKLDVVTGAMAERMSLREKFVRKSATLKSYGTLITLPYCLDSEGRSLFPGAVQDTAVHFERGECELCGNLKCIKLKVIEWAIPKVSLSHA